MTERRTLPYHVADYAVIRHSRHKDGRCIFNCAVYMNSEMFPRTVEVNVDSTWWHHEGSINDIKQAAIEKARSE